VALIDLALHVDETVRVGGIVVDVAPDGITLDDGTAPARVVVEPGAAGLARVLERGDAINATGVPEGREGEVVLVVRDPAGLVLVGGLGDDGAGSPAPSSLTMAAILAGGPVGGADGQAPTGLRASLAGGTSPATVGLATILLTGLLGAGVVGYRAATSRRRERARIRARLDAIAGPVPATAGPPEVT
jgi:hypothetical protein